MFRLFLLISAFAYGYCAIHTTNDLMCFEQELSHCDDSTLVLFDIGGTVLEPVDTLLHLKYLPWIQNWYQKHFLDISQSEICKNIKLIQRSANWRLTDPRWPELIELAVTSGATAIPFTRVIYDASGHQKRIELYEELGLNFSEGNCDVDGSLFQFHDGILETQHPLKGAVLEEFLKNSEVGKVIFVDDQLEQVESVYQYCESRGIPCEAFHYLSPLPAPALNEKWANMQMLGLVHSNKWIADRDLICCPFCDEAILSYQGCE
ncbi:MAG: DUF2608 domain-containing protein [Simkaniaceae bacterium]|nr:DUF2608 domain-containing protein [Simkaniaceae bacterium]